MPNADAIIWWQLKLRVILKATMKRWEELTFTVSIRKIKRE